MFLGIAIGDGLGVPVETMQPDEISDKFGRITTYIRNGEHKWYKDFAIGQWSDDTQLSLAIAESEIQKRCVNVNDIAMRHIKAMGECSIGWGRSTKDSIACFKNGEHWSNTGNPNGAGNGVAMKVAPIGALMLADALSLSKKKSLYFSEYCDAARRKIFPKIVDLSIMTHKSSIAIASGLAQADATFTCLNPDIERNFEDQFLNNVLECCWIGERINVGDTITDRLSERIEKIIYTRPHKNMTVNEIAKLFGDATCYVYNSLPFCYAAFLKNPRSIETLYDVVNAGGDTDTNGSIVGALLGALNGTKIFPKHLIDGMWRREYVLDVANRFCKKFEIKND